MLPLLPALLLLILQGPSSVERMALEGRLPAALEAIHRQMEAGDPQGALIRLLSLGEPATDTKATPHLTVEEDKQDTPPPAEPSSTRITKGFAKSQRSRDGPF